MSAIEFRRKHYPEELSISEIYFLIELLNFDISESNLSNEDTTTAEEIKKKLQSLQKIN